MKKIEAFQTSDNTIFQHENEAIIHEIELTKKQLNVFVSACVADKKSQELMSEFIFTHKEAILKILGGLPNASDKYIFYSELTDYIFNDRKLAAVKLIKEKTGLGLREAKNIADTISFCVRKRDHTKEEIFPIVSNELKNHPICNQE